MDQVVEVVKPRARTTDPSTSHAAAASMKSAAIAQRMAALGCLSAYPEGLVHSEIDELLTWPAHTAGRRLPELREMGLAQKTGQQRKTSSGRFAAVYAITDLGRLHLGPEEGERLTADLEEAAGRHARELIQYAVRRGLA